MRGRNKSGHNLACVGIKEKLKDRKTYLAARASLRRRRSLMLTMRRTLFSLIMSRTLL